MADATETLTFELVSPERLLVSHRLSERAEADFHGRGITLLKAAGGAIGIAPLLEKTLGTEHPVYATSLNNLAGLYNDMGDYSRAEPLYEQAMKIWNLRHNAY